MLCSVQYYPVEDVLLCYTKGVVNGPDLVAKLGAGNDMNWDERMWMVKIPDECWMLFNVVATYCDLIVAHDLSQHCCACQVILMSEAQDRYVTSNSTYGNFYRAAVARQDSERVRSHFLWSDYHHSWKSRMQVCRRYIVGGEWVSSFLTAHQHN